jgi:hypothetical protein
VEENKNLEENNETVDLFLGYIYLKNEENKLLEEKEELKKKLDKYEKVQKDDDDDEDEDDDDGSDRKDRDKKKRFRKKKNEIKRNFCCYVRSCDKSYGLFK